MPKPHSISSWIVAGILLSPAVYVLSFGPACWLAAEYQNGMATRPAPGMIAYLPLGKVMALGPRHFSDSLM